MLMLTCVACVGITCKIWWFSWQKSFQHIERRITDHSKICYISVIAYENEQKSAESIVVFLQCVFKLSYKFLRLYRVFVINTNLVKN